MAEIEKQSKKIHPPRIVLYEHTIEEFQKLSDNRKCSLSQLYQEACDLYLQVSDYDDIIGRLKNFLHKIR